MSRIFLLACIGLCACTSAKPPAKQEPKPVSVLVTSPKRCDVPIFIESLGTLKPAASLEVRSQLKALLNEILVEEGQIVQAGAILFRLDSQSFAYRLEQAEAQSALHQAELDACVKKLDRYRALVSKDLIAPADWDALETEVAKAKAEITQAVAKRKEAKLDLEHCTIRSSIAGRVGKLELAPGHLVDESTVLTTVLTMDPLLAEFTLSEAEFQQVAHTHSQVLIQSLCCPDSKAEGTISYMESQFDPKSAKLKVHARIANPELHLRPGLSIGVKIPLAVIANAVVVPHKCVQHTPQGPCLYIVQEDKSVVIRPVELGEALDDVIVVKEGLAIEDVVITDGHSRITQGIKVQIQS